MIKKGKYVDFFPYPVFRVEQDNFIIQIEKNNRLRKNILLISPKLISDIKLMNFREKKNEYYKNK